MKREESYQLYKTDLCGFCYRVRDFAEQNGKSDIFIIGGAEVYRQAIDFADKAYITEVHADFDGDAVFDILDLSNWKEISRDYHSNEISDLPYSFVVLTRISK